jgi:hypothetical protein
MAMAGDINNLPNQQPCRTCGTCPTCGHTPSPYRFAPTWTWYPPQPHWVPPTNAPYIYPQTTWGQPYTTGHTTYAPNSSMTGLVTDGKTDGASIQSANIRIEGSTF